MITDQEVTSTIGATRVELHRVAAHILGRRRFEISGRFGLRSGPGGIATPAFGEEPEALRISGTYLVRERGGSCRFAPIAGSTLRTLADFADVDLSGGFDFGEQGPAVGDPDAPVIVDPEAVWLITEWFALGWCVLDEVMGALPRESEPATIQLWPEHFDAGTNVALQSGERVNLGFSAGDSFEEEPYAYIGPWGPERPGDSGFWNAPFGSVLRRSEAVKQNDVASACKEFLERGIGLLSESKPGN
jgi:hypothetical protein